MRTLITNGHIVTATDDFHGDILIDDEQITALEKERAAWNAGEIAKSEVTSMPLPDYIHALFANGREHIEADLRFMRYLREALPTAPHLPLIPPLKEKENS